MSTWTEVTDQLAAEAVNLQIKIADLRIALVNCREAAEFNLHNPGNENDTLEYVIAIVSNALGDDYTYEPDE